MSSYTDEEVRFILNELFLEKKKVDTLEVAAKTAPAPTEELTLLRHQIEKLKTELKQQKKSQPSEKLLLEIRQKDLEILRLKEFETCYKKTIQQKQHVEENFEKASKFIQHAKGEICKLQEELKFYQDQKIEFQTLQGQYGKLRETISSLQKQTKEQAIALNVKEEARQLLSKEVKRLTGVEKELEQVKLTLGKMVREKELLEENLNVTLQEKTAALNRNIQLGQHLEKEKEQKELLQEELKKLEEDKIKMQEALSTLESDFHEKQELKEALKTIQQAHDEKESDLKLAQHHLAKKVKEITLLQEKFDNQAKNFQEVESTIQGMQEHFNETKAGLETQLQTMRQAKEELQSKLKTEELRAARSEKKYTDFYEKHSNLEKQVRELRLTEEKYLELKKLLSQLTQALGHTVDPISRKEAFPPEVSEKAKIQPIAAYEIPLFEASVKPFTVKEHLFD